MSFGQAVPEAHVESFSFALVRVGARANERKSSGVGYFSIAPVAALV
jgi:hypothetical protein